MPHETETATRPNGSSNDGSSRAEVPATSSLTTAERLQASTLASSFVLQIASLKAPLRRLVLEEVRRFLGED